MKILIDGDACPVVKLTEQIAKEYELPVILLCDTNHVMHSEYSEIRIIGAGADAVDFALISLCAHGDIIVTQDYGVAALGLSKGSHPIHQNGMWYTNENIDALLNERYLSKKSRIASAKHHMKGPPKRTRENDIRFAESLRHLIESSRSNSEK